MGFFVRIYMRVCKKMVIYLGIKTPQSRKERKYTGQKNARISCHNFETNSPPFKMAEHFTRFKTEELGELLANNIARLARRQLHGRYLLFGENLQNWKTLYLLNLPINMNYRR